MCVPVSWILGFSIDLQTTITEIKITTTIPEVLSPKQIRLSLSMCRPSLQIHSGGPAVCQRAAKPWPQSWPCPFPLGSGEAPCQIPGPQAFLPALRKWLCCALVRLAPVGIWGFFFNSSSSAELPCRDAPPVPRPDVWGAFHLPAEAML